MKKSLEKLGFNSKEAQVYVYLIEYGISPASEISKYISIPKSTVNFLADNLWKKWILTKSFRWKTWYYEADIKNLKEYILDDVQGKQQALEYILPTLQEKNKNTISKPKIFFLDGLESCKKAYLELLKVEKVFLEFGAHSDLENAFGKEFMEKFITSRVKKWIFCDAIGSDEKVEQELQKKDKEDMRSLQIFSSQFWSIYSSIAIYNSTVLLLNLRGIYTGIVIENTEFAETMKTIFYICARKN